MKQLYIPLQLCGAFRTGIVFPLYTRKLRHKGYKVCLVRRIELDLDLLPHYHHLAIRSAFSEMCAAEHQFLGIFCQEAWAEKCVCVCGVVCMCMHVIPPTKQSLKLGNSFALVCSALFCVFKALKNCAVRNESCLILCGQSVPKVFVQ